METDTSALLVLYKLGQNAASSPISVLIKPTGTFVSPRSASKKSKTSGEHQGTGPGKK